MDVLDGKHYKYIHLLWAKELKFNKPLIEFFYNPQCGFDVSKHAFITPYRTIYEKLGNYENVYCDDVNKNLFNFYKNNCAYFISHGLPGRKIVFGIQHSVKRKTVYRYWGGRPQQKPLVKGRPLINLCNKSVSKLREYIFKKLYGDFLALGVANISDILDLRKVLKNIPLYPINYVGSAEYYQAIEYEKQIGKRKKESLHVMIGHRSYPAERHAYYIDLLNTRYGSEKMQIFIPLSYGDAEYANEVKKHVANKEYKNVTIICDLMPYPEYVKLLNDMDVVLIDCETSEALGNIGIHLALGNTIYISTNGILREAFEKTGTPYRCLDDIKNMSYQEFSCLLKIDDNVGYDLKEKPFEVYIQDWKRLLDFLDSKLVY